MMRGAEPRTADRFGVGDETVVTTGLGALRGIECEGVQTFRGIRYAQAPTGVLRFRPPVPAAAWKGVADATAFGPVPFQPYDPSVGHGANLMSEDCLSLNVWAPTQPGPHPVLVWIHGGGQTVGSTRRAEYEGSHFARNGIVCVTVGYRLGVFGFLELGQLLGPTFQGSGNNAIRDLLMALQWVNLNICAFGGDPARVTLGGESAGAKNAVTLAGVPEARGLFHRIVVCSGGAHTVHHTSEAEAVARLLCEEARLPAEQGRALLALPAIDLLAAQESTVRHWGSKFAFRPVVDGSLIPAPVLDQIDAGSCAALPALIGTTRDECAAMFDPSTAADPPLACELAHVAPAIFLEIERRLGTLLPEQPVAGRRARALTAEEYWIPSVRLAEALSRRGAAVWMYRFDGVPAQAGVSALHVADLPLWWGHHRPSSPASAITGPAGTATAMHAALAAFVRGEDLASGTTQGRWPRYDSTDRLIMSLGSRLAIQQDPDQTERALWDGVL